MSDKNNKDKGKNVIKDEVGKNDVSLNSIKVYSKKFFLRK